MRFLIVGAAGYVGKELLKKVNKLNSASGIPTSVSESLSGFRLDSSSEFDFRFIQPSDVVLLTAAISEPDICAREHARAWAVNVTGTSAFIAEVIARGGRVIFFSSDMVYGERDDEFDESADCNPAGEYAEMKCEVEQRFLGNPLFKAIRLSYVFSHEDKFTKYLSGCALQGDVAEVFHPFYRAVVHREDVVAGAIALAQRWGEFPQQYINFGGPMVLSRADFAKNLQEVALPTLLFRITEPEFGFFNNRPRVIQMASPILPLLLRRPAHTLNDAARIEFDLTEGR